jgi:hypothetical protein
MRHSGILIAGLLLLFGLDATNAFEPDPVAFAPVQEDKKAEDQEKGEKEEAKKDAKEEDDSKDEDAPEKEAVKEVVKTPALDAVRSLTDSYDSKTQEFMKATRDKNFMKGYREAAKEGRDAVTKYLKSKGQPDREQYLAEMEQIAAQSMAWIAANGPAEKRQSALDFMFENYADSEAMELVVGVSGFGVPRPKAEARFRSLIKENPSETVKALATMSLADLMARGAEGETLKEVEALYETVVKKYASVERRGVPIGDSAKDALFEIQYLSIGKEAPEIAAEDLDGVEFKLTDYRGKIVLLDFWGNW